MSYLALDCTQMSHRCWRSALNYVLGHCHRRYGTALVMTSLYADMVSNEICKLLQKFRRAFDHVH